MKEPVAEFTRSFARWGSSPRAARGLWIFLALLLTLGFVNDLVFHLAQDRDALGDHQAFRLLWYVDLTLFSALVVLGVFYWRQRAARERLGEETVRLIEHVALQNTLLELGRRGLEASGHREFAAEVIDELLAHVGAERVEVREQEAGGGWRGWWRDRGAADVVAGPLPPPDAFAEAAMAAPDLVRVNSWAAELRWPRPPGLPATADSTLVAAWRTTGGRPAALAAHFPEGRSPDADVAYAIQAAALLLAEMRLAESSRQDVGHALSLLRATLEATVDGLLVIDVDGRVRIWNQRFLETWGIEDLVVGQDASALSRDLQVKLADGERLPNLEAGPVDRPARRVLRTREGNIVECQVRPQVMDGVTMGRVWSFRDITQKQHVEDRLAWLAQNDPLTGLANRSLLLDRLETAVARADRHRDKVALLYLDLDRFKQVNDRLGHEAGDVLLKETATRLKTVVRETDTVARLGGDEFNIVLEGLASAKDAGRVAGQIVDAINKPFVIHGEECSVTPSIGIAVYPDVADSAAELMRAADLAMYEVKEQGRNGIQFFLPEMSRVREEKARLIAALRDGLPRGEFRIHYQPQVDTLRGRVVGAEAFLRWQSPDRGLVRPDVFLDALEESGLIVPVGHWIFDTVCTQLRAWRELGHDMRVCLNISPRQFRQPRFLQVLKALVEANRLTPDNIELEISENLFMQNTLDRNTTLFVIKQLGFHIAVDQFGTSYSSLSYLKRFPISAIKIDDTLVRGVQRDENNAQVVLAVIRLAQSLGLRIVAAGVETADELGFLRPRGAEVVQGYLVCPPLPAEELTTWLQSGAASVWAGRSDAAPPPRLAPGSEMGAHDSHPVRAESAPVSAWPQAPGGVH